MAHTVLKLVLLVQVLCIYITVSSTPSSFSQFKCIDSPGRVPKILDIILQDGPLVPSIPTAIGISAFQCASLCVEAKFNACQSYSYDSVTRHCFTHNITLYQTGILCGIPVDQSQEKCQTTGETLIAYGGTNKTMMECISGKRNENWDRAYGDPLPYDCINACTNSSTCAIHIGGAGYCGICHDKVSTCFLNVVSVNKENALICVPIPP